MFAIYGTEQVISQKFIGDPFETQEIEHLVAIFDSFDEAELYIEHSKLKKPIKKTYCGVRSFKSNSLLSCCSRAEVREYYPPPTNPKISK